MTTAETRRTADLLHEARQHLHATGRDVSALDGAADSVRALWQRERDAGLTEPSTAYTVAERALRQACLRALERDRPVTRLLGGCRFCPRYASDGYCPCVDAACSHGWLTQPDETVLPCPTCRPADTPVPSPEPPPLW